MKKFGMILATIAALAVMALEHPPLKLTRSRRGRNSFGIPVA
jgi:hypothetical protein